jgi:hypothetical protein
MKPTSTPTDPLTELFDELKGDSYCNPDEDITSFHWHWPGRLSPGFLTILALPTRHSLLATHDN